MKIDEWLIALSYLYKFMLDSAVDYPVWKIEQVIECFTEDEKNEAILFYIRDANLDDYKTCNKQRLIAQWVCKADCFIVRNNTKTALEYLEAYELTEVLNKTNMDPEVIAEKHKYYIDMRFNDCTIQTVAEVIEAANKDLLRQINSTKYFHIHPKTPTIEEQQEINRQLDEKYLRKRGLSHVPKMLQKKPGVIAKRHKTEVARLLTERMSEINTMIDSPLKKYLNFYMEAQIEKEVSNMIREGTGGVTTVKEAREKYKPEKIKYLLIAEAPPDAIERFFYFENVKTKDYLFLGIMEVLDKNLKEKYLESKRDPIIKKSMLEIFRNNGFFLVDLLEQPSQHYNNLNQARKNAVPDMIDRLNKIITKETPIILIKVTVYDKSFRRLQEAGYNVINARIEFPAQNHPIQFRNHFKAALEEANWDINKPLSHPSES
ncbi:MAG: hypothetical protein PHF24_10150 [Syntrophomonas sp.]|nr:hypothetical protein [Syntrophomonas sp.]